MCHITGYSKDQLRDIDETKLAREDEKERVKLFKQKITESPQGIQGLEFWINTRSGQEKCLKNTYTFFAKKQWQTHLVLTSFRQIFTARKRVETSINEKPNGIQDAGR